MSRSSRVPRGSSHRIAGFVLLAMAVANLLGPATGHAEEPAAIPPPFEPIRVEDGESALAVHVWGRTYRFGAGPLPDSVTSQGRELLVGPARVLLDGQPLSWSRPRVEEARPDAVRLTSGGSRGPLRARAAVRIEYDGMIQVDLEVSGAGNISSLRYELPLQPEHATRFAHHAAYDYKNLNIDKMASIDTAGATPASTRRFAFTPSFWLGDREVGIEWWSETNAHWHGPHAKRPFVVERADGRVVLAVEPVSSALSVREGEPWSDRFALFPMPMRPPPPDWRSIRFVSTGLQSPRFEESGDARVVWIAFPNDFRARWHGLPGAVQDEFQTKLRSRLAARGIAYIPYGKLTLAPSFHPTTLARFEDWSAAGVWYKKPLASEKAVFDRNGDRYETGQPYTYAACMGRKDFLDWMLEENLKAFRAEKLDGLYFDHGTITRMCTESPLLRGRPGREVWEYFNVRDFYRRLYTAMKAQNPDALLVIHSVGQPRAISAFVDVHLIGEHINKFFAGGRARKVLTASPELYAPDYLDLPEGYLDGLALPHVGGIWTIIPQIKYGATARQRADHRALQAWTLLNDVPTAIANTDMKEAEAIARALDRFGSLADAEVHPWWSIGERVRVPEPLRATLYRTGARGLLVVANLADQPAGGAVTLDRAALGLAGARRWRNLETTGRAQPLEEGGFPVQVPARDFRLFVIE